MDSPGRRPGAAHDLRRLERRYVALTALRWLPVGVLFPVIVVIVRARGIPVEAVGPLLAGYGAVVLLFELPTGGLADRWGRRRVHLLASAIGVIGILSYGLAESWGWFALSMLPLGLNRALLSGPLEAWFVDESHRVDPDADLDRAYARAESWGAVAMGVGALATALLPQVVSLPESGRGLIAPSLPLLVSAALEAVHFLAALLLMRPATPPAARSDSESQPNLGATIRAAVHTARTMPMLRRVLVATAVAHVAMVATEQVVPIDLVRLLGEADAASLYAGLSAAAFAATAVGARLAAPLASWASPRTAYAGTLALVASGLVVMGVAGSTMAIAVAFLAMYFLMGPSTPLQSMLVHTRITADQRATVLSVNSLVGQGTGFLASLVLLPLYAVTSPRVGFLVPASIVLVGAWALGRPLDEGGAGVEPRTVSAAPTPDGPSTQAS